MTIEDVQALGVRFTNEQLHSFLEGTDELRGARPETNPRPTLCNVHS